MNDDTDEIFNIIEIKPTQKPTPQQENNIKTVQKIKIEDDEELKYIFIITSINIIFNKFNIIIFTALISGL